MLWYKLLIAWEVGGAAMAMQEARSESDNEKSSRRLREEKVI
jgi:hypothetical protein